MYVKVKAWRWQDLLLNTNYYESINKTSHYNSQNEIYSSKKLSISSCVPLIQHKLSLCQNKSATFSYGQLSQMSYIN